MALTACGDDTTDTAGSASSVAPPAASASAIASAAPSTPAADTAAGTTDKAICESANKAGETMKDEFVAALQSGKEPTPAALKKILTAFTDRMTAATATASDSKVTAAVKQMGAEASKAAAAANPIEAADNPDFVKAGSDLTAACKAAGVTVNF
jgi:hypothetical protein